MNAVPLTAATELDLARCADEPIHIPGYIQPHGALIAADATSLTITHVSTNFCAASGMAPDQALGRNLAELIGADACAVILGSLAGDPPVGGMAVSRLLTMPDGAPCGVLAHRNGEKIIVELEPARPAEYEAALALAQTAVARLRDTHSCEQLGQGVVRELRALTGYDRMMVYRFDSEEHGEIIAEDRVPEIEPYLHLRFPATDIPAQARRLYMLQRVRIIPDISYAPVAILGGGPLDMSYCGLRSVSPVHLEYLYNMEVAATLAISIVHEDRLWGMVIGHHRTPLSPSPGQRALFELLGQFAGLLITEAETRSRMEAQLTAQQRLAALAQHIEDGGSTIDGLAHAAPELLHMVNAAGGFILLRGQARSFGAAPPEAAASAMLARLLVGGGDKIEATSRLGELDERFQNEAASASGVLMIPFAADPGDGLLFFRPELPRTVKWGGDPRNKAELDPRDGRIRPRRSFAAWVEILRGQSEPWSQTDLLAAQGLRGVLTRALLRRSEAELMLISNSDPLTGLPNRRALERSLAIWQLQPNPPVAALLFLDLDRFKTVNDSLGHHAGDELLRDVVRRFAGLAGGSLAGGGLAGPNQMLARLGGDEFVIFCIGMDLQGASALAARILSLFEAPFWVGGRAHRVAVSIGIAVSGAGPHDLMREADAAMYAAKRQGGSRAVIFQALLHSEALEKLRIEQDLFLALERDELVLHYQPVVMLPGRDARSFEALIRWQHPERGLLMPGSFIGIAEETGQIGRVGNWVVNEALRQLATIATPDIRFSINVSAHQLTSGKFHEEVRTMLARHGVRAEMIVFEVTEGTLMNDTAVRELERLRVLGARIAIDDFGTGYSSLAYLRRMPVDAVKIDRSFIANLDSDPRAENFLRAVIELAHTLDLRVVAEGVETQPQCDLLSALGCDLAQGYFFSRPQPLAAFGLALRGE
jgi:diguanylate cyclase (GGDEF)-like protein